MPRLVTGTNNIQNEDCTGILSAYRVLIDRAKKVENRKITMVGIMKRFDSAETEERKRSLVNMKLREMCQEKKVEFLNFDLQPSMTERDGIHLSCKGRNYVGHEIMKYCLNFLE